MSHTHVLRSFPFLYNFCQNPGKKFFLYTPYVNNCCITAAFSVFGERQWIQLYPSPSTSFLD